MKHHLQDSLQQLNGDVFIGHALQWTIDNVFIGTPNLRKNKVIFVISAGETNPLDKEVLRNVSLRAKCQGYSIFVFSFGPLHNDKELEQLASQPLDHHLVQLGRTHKPDMNYIIKFVKPFVHSVRRKSLKFFSSVSFTIDLMSLHNPSIDLKTWSSLQSRLMESKVWVGGNEKTIEKIPGLSDLVLCCCTAKVFARKWSVS